MTAEVAGEIGDSEETLQGASYVAAVDCGRVFVALDVKARKISGGR